MSHDLEIETPPSFDPRLAITLENTAVRLARAAGDRIYAAFSQPLRVDFKAATPGAAANSNPVSEVDRAVEDFIRAELAREFPEHGVIGEEGAAMASGAGITWVIDPIDGTTNYINGVPLFACSIGVLLEGWPLAGAIWCASTHALRPGVYHAHRGDTLQFDNVPHARRPAGAWRGLASEPGRTPEHARHWDTRVFGSATLECAFVAAGLLQLAYLGHPSLWDAAAALALLEAAGCEARTYEHSRWAPLRRFKVDCPRAGGTATLGTWRQPLLAGDTRALDIAVR